MRFNPIIRQKKVTLFYLSILFCLSLIILYSCKKDTSELDTATNKNVTPLTKTQQSFFTIPQNAPDELKLIVGKMQGQFQPADIDNFISWHGYPLWDKIIKFKPQKNGTITYAIPVQKDGKITSFFAASIDRTGLVQFEMHKEAAVQQSIGEYSYANITLNANKRIFYYFTGKKEYNVKATSQTAGLWDCWFAWMVDSFHGQGSQSATGQANGHWESNCAGGSGGPGGGGTGEPGGGGGSGNEPPCTPPDDSFVTQWWNNQTNSLTSCQQDWYDGYWMTTNIKDSTLNPCVASTLATLKEINSKLPTLIRGFFNTNPTFRMRLLSYYDSNCSGIGNICTPDAAFTSQVPSNDSFDIKINSYYLNATNLSIAATLIHESLHAQLSQWVREALINHDTVRQHELATLYGSVFTEDFRVFDSTVYSKALEGTYQHELIAIQYRNLIAQALYEFAQKKNINITTSTCQILAWSGLQSSAAFKRLSQTNRDYITDMINAERDPYGNTVNVGQLSYYGHACY